MRELRCRPVALLMLVLVLVLSLGSCMTWQLTTVSPRQVIEGARPSRVRVTSWNGAQVVIDQPRVQNDSIVVVGEQCQAGVVAVNGRPCARPVLALDEVRAVEVERVRGMGALVVVGAVVAVGAIYLLLADFSAQLEEACYPIGCDPSWFGLNPER
jgi:hypothetical protein